MRARDVESVSSVERSLPDAVHVFTKRNPGLHDQLSGRGEDSVLTVQGTHSFAILASALARRAVVVTEAPPPGRANGSIGSYPAFQMSADRFQSLVSGVESARDGLRAVRASRIWHVEAKAQFVAATRAFHQEVEKLRKFVATQELDLVRALQASQRGDRISRPAALLACRHFSDMSKRLFTGLALVDLTLEERVRIEDVQSAAIDELDRRMTAANLKDRIYAGAAMTGKSHNQRERDADATFAALLPAMRSVSAAILISLSAVCRSTSKP